jgi:predicted amidophosphoribosyltransferase
MDDEDPTIAPRRARWTGVVSAPLTLLAPPRCVACRVRGPIPWCARCRRQVRELPVAGCPRCAAARRPGHPCWPQDAPIAGTVAAFDYRGPVAAAIVSAKVAGAHAGWTPLAASLARRVVLSSPAVDAVTWVRTAASRRRRRGLDHAELLARAVASALDLPVVAALDARPGPDGRDRYRATHRFPGTELLLVDDVLTTGATAVRAATALCLAGAGRPQLAVVARAGPHPLAGPVEDEGAAHGARRWV